MHSIVDEHLGKLVASDKQPLSDIQQP